jgi:hypothetical protein
MTHELDDVLEALWTGHLHVLRSTKRADDALYPSANSEEIYEVRDAITKFAAYIERTKDHVLVPREPSREMMLNVFRDVPCHGIYMGYFKDKYKAMIEAAQEESDDQG